MKVILFKRLKVLNLLSQRAFDIGDHTKHMKYKNRAELIEYSFSKMPIINRDIIF